MIQNAIIKYKIRLTHGAQSGGKIEISLSLNDLEENDISDKLIEDGYYKSMGWPTDYYEILERNIILQ